MCPALLLRAALASLLFCVLVACAKSPAPSPPATVPEAEETGAHWLFRHRVQVNRGEKTLFSFDGLMRLYPEQGRARAAGLAPMSTLFVMDVERAGRRTLYIHPRLRNVPGIEENIAACIRALWLNAPAPAALSGYGEEKKEDFASLLWYEAAGRTMVRVQLIDAEYKRDGSKLPAAPQS